MYLMDPKGDFVEVPVRYAPAAYFSRPKLLTEFSHGTTLEIFNLRSEWPRQKLLKLKSALSKLINPFGEESSGFEIKIIAPDELEADATTLGDEIGDFSSSVEEEHYYKIVNGKVENFIFETLRKKTTHLEVFVSDDGSQIYSSLIDRGEMIYRIGEPNSYDKLEGSGFRCNLYYLNQSARLTFARRMGVPSVQFGSIFLFRNGFRAFPVGEEGDDTFGLDRRKQQGHSRFLGTREIIGRIDVFGTEADFKESTSRDQGLIETPAYQQLRDCFREKCLKRLERYVVDISWRDKADKDADDISRMLGDKASARITDMIARLSNADGVQLLDYNPRIVRILNEKSEDFHSSIESLKAVARNTNDRTLVERLTIAESRYLELQKAEAEARAKAERERQARLDAEARARSAKAESEVLKGELEEEKKRSLFLASVTTIDHDTIVNLHHQIVIYATDMQLVVANQLERLYKGETLGSDHVQDIFEHITFRTQQILSVSRFASKANFRLDSEMIKADLASFILQYLEQVAPLYEGDGLAITTSSSASGLDRRFKPIEVSMILDNLVSNSKKLGASRLDFAISQPKASELQIIVTDDGPGVDPKIDPQDRIFDKGVTTTDGSGLGLYYVRYMLDQMRGTIEFDQTYKTGARFRMRLFS
jgi:signal transduction histidine kinase